MTTEWLQVELLCDINQVESLGSQLIEAGALGTEERSPTPTASVFFPTPETHDELLLVTYFPAEISTKKQAEVTEIAIRFGVQQHTIIWSRIRDDGWSTKWQAFFQPLPIGKQILICPTWEKPPSNSDRKLIWLDPGMAFGTGHHATTRGCIQLLERILPTKPSCPVLDVGCGSGILSIAAIKLQAKEVDGIDIDSDAVKIAVENAELNHVKKQCHFSTKPIENIEQVYPLIVANIQAHILRPMAPALVARLESKGSLILSGIWHLFKDEVLETYGKLGCTCKAVIEDEGWCSLLLEGTN